MKTYYVMGLRKVSPKIHKRFEINFTSNAFRFTKIH